MIRRALFTEWDGRRDLRGWVWAVAFLAVLVCGAVVR